MKGEANTTYLVDNIRLFCQKADTSPNAVAKALGIPASTLYRIVDRDPARRHTPRIGTVTMLADYFGVSPRDLLYKKFDWDTPVHIANSASPGGRLSEAFAEPGGGIPVGAETLLSRQTPRGAVVPFFSRERPFTLEDYARIYEGVPFTDQRMGVARWLPMPPFPLDRRAASSLVAIEVTGDAMLPELADGDIVYCADIETQDGTAGTDRRGYRSGTLVLASTDGKRLTVRKLLVDDEGNRWLARLNREVPGERMAKAERVVGRAVAVARKTASS